MRKLSFRFVFCVCCLMALFVVQLFAAEYRSWTDVSGNYQVEAMLLDSDGKVVKLKRKDTGKVISMPLDKLSLADRAEVKRTLGGSPANPFEGGAANEEDDESDAASASSKTKTGVVKFGKIRELRTNNASTTWSIEPDPAKVSKLDYEPEGLTFPLKKQESGVFKTGDNFFFCDDIPDRVLGVIHLSKSSKRQTVVFVGDLKKSSVKSTTLPADLVPFGLTPNGKLAIFRQKIDGERTGSSERALVISDVEDEKFSCLQVIEPFAKVSSRTNIRWAAWADNDNIIAMATSGEVVLFNRTDLTAIWSYSMSTNSHPELSPCRKYIVMPGKTGGLFLLETLTGKIVGNFEIPAGISIHRMSMAFSPDGKLFAALLDDVLYRWDITSGKAKEPFHIDTTGALCWINETYLMVGSILIDAKADYPLRQYRGTANTDKTYAGLYWIMRSAASIRNANDNFELAALTIPHIKSPPLKDIPDSQRYSVVPGMKVKVQVESGVPDGDRVREHLIATVEKNGLIISDDAEITLSAEITQLEPEKASYSTRFSPMRSGGTEVMVTPNKMYIGFKKGGEKLWGRSTTTSVPSVSLEEIANRSLQEVVNEKAKPTPDWYLTTKIPVKVLAMKVGESLITINGIK